MIDCKTCNNIVKMLEKGQIRELKEYVENENKITYLEEARKALLSYLNERRGTAIPFGYYDYFQFTMCNLLLTDYCSAYFLKSAEILTPNEKRRVSGTFHKKSIVVMNLYDELEKKQISVEKIERVEAGVRDKSPLVDLWTEGNHIHTFYEKEFSFAEKFLGNDLEYSVADTDYFEQGAVCLVKSNKGTGFILGKKH